MDQELPAGGGRPAAAFGPVDLASSVAGDLQDIFQASDAPQPATEAKARPIRDHDAAGRRRSAAQTGGMIAAAVGGLALGVLLVGGGAQKARTVDENLIVAQAPAAARVTSTPSAAATPPPITAPAPQASPTAEPARVAAAPVKAAPEPTRRVSAAATKQARREKPTRVAERGGRCEDLRGGARARCAYPEVMAADRRLRRAYAMATRAGVSNGELIRYRDRWASLRHRADDQPSRVIRAYSEMSSDLTRLARDARS